MIPNEFWSKPIQFHLHYLDGEIGIIMGVTFHYSTI